MSVAAIAIVTLCAQAFVDKFRYNAKRASLVQSRIKAIERLGEVDVVEDDPEYIFKWASAHNNFFQLQMQIWNCTWYLRLVIFFEKYYEREHHSKCFQTQNPEIKEASINSCHFACFTQQWPSFVLLTSEYGLIGRRYHPRLFQAPSPFQNVGAGQRREFINLDSALHCMHCALVQSSTIYIIFRFPDPQHVAGQMVSFQDVDFHYPGGPQLFNKLDFGLDMESRLAMVGANGPNFVLHQFGPFCRIQAESKHVCMRPGW